MHINNYATRVCNDAEVPEPLPVQELGGIGKRTSATRAE